MDVNDFDPHPPSGSLTPSEADKAITEKIKKAANLM